MKGDKEIVGTLRGFDDYVNMVMDAMSWVSCPSCLVKCRLLSTMRIDTAYCVDRKWRHAKWTESFASLCSQVMTSLCTLHHLYCESVQSEGPSSMVWNWGCSRVYLHPAGEEDHTFGIDRLACVAALSPILKNLTMETLSNPNLCVPQTDLQHVLQLLT